MGLYLDPPNVCKREWFVNNVSHVQLQDLIDGTYPTDKIPLFYNDHGFQIIGIGYSKAETKRFATRLLGAIFGLADRDVVEKAHGRKLPR